MKNFFYYARVTNNSDCNNVCKILDINKLHPIDSLKVVCEQYILADYLRRTNCTDRSNDIQQIASDLHNKLPSTIGGGLSVYSNIYKIGLDILACLRRQLYKSINPIQLSDLFDLDVDKEYDKSLYTASIPTNFLYIWLNLATNFSSDTIFPSGKMFGAPFLVPEVRACYVTTDKCAPITGDLQKWKCTIDFTAYPAGSYELSSHTSGLLNIIERYSFLDVDFMKFLGILSRFSLERDKYDMMNSATRQTKKIGIQDVCFDLVTSNAKELCAENLIARYGSYDFRGDLNTFIRMVDSGKLTKIETDNKDAYCWIAPFLEICGADRKLVNYFVKPVGAIVASESFAYKQSGLDKLIAPRLIIGLEADNEAPSLDDSDNSVNEDTASEQDGNEPDMSGGDDDAPDNSESDVDAAKEAKDIDHRPTIDPKMMILELTSPAVALSDYLYRDLVARRISYILDNPPRNARPEVLQILRTWKAQWLFLVSIPTLRDFLSRIAIRLS